MGNTGAPWSLRYPEGSDPVRLSQYFRNLAEDTDAALDVLNAQDSAAAMALFAFHRSADWNLPADGYNHLSLDVASYDPAGVWNAGGGNGSFKAPRSGWVMFYARAGFIFSGAQSGNLNMLMAISSSATGAAPFTDNLIRGTGWNQPGAQVVGNSDHAVTIAVPMLVAANTYYLPRPYVAAPGLVKTVLSGAGNCWFRGHYLPGQ